MENTNNNKNFVKYKLLVKRVKTKKQYHRSWTQLWVITFKPSVLKWKTKKYIEISFSQSQGSQGSQGDMEIMYTELALYERTNLCARTDNIFSPISEVCNGTVSLISLTINENLSYIKPKKISSHLTLNERNIYTY